LLEILSRWNASAGSKLSANILMHEDSLRNWYSSPLPNWMASDSLERRMRSRTSTEDGRSLRQTCSKSVKTFSSLLWERSLTTSSGVSTTAGATKEARRSHSALRSRVLFSTRSRISSTAWGSASIFLWRKKFTIQPFFWLSNISQKTVWLALGTASAIFRSTPEGGSLDTRMRVASAAGLRM